MKRLEGRAASVVNAPLADCFAALRAVDRYPDWLRGYVERVVVTEHDHAGDPVRAHVVVHVAQSPFAKRFEFDLAIRADRHAIHLARLPVDPSDRERLRLSWLLYEADATRVELEFAASATFIPSLVPLPGVGNLIARTLLDAAINALRGPGAPPAGAQCSKQ